MSLKALSSNELSILTLRPLLRVPASEKQTDQMAVIRSRHLWGNLMIGESETMLCEISILNWQQLPQKLWAIVSMTINYCRAKYLKFNYAEYATKPTDSKINVNPW